MAKSYSMSRAGTDAVPSSKYATVDLNCSAVAFDTTAPPLDKLTGISVPDILVTESTKSLPPPELMTGQEHSLRVRELTVAVKTWNGSWWNCGCCRRYEQRILTEVNLTAYSGQLVAFIGNSGSGKSTLLNAISNRHTGPVTGSVQLDNQTLTYKRFCNKAGYVIQADRLLARLTVRETLMYTAKLKFCGKLTDDEIDIKILRCLRQMSLMHVADTIVGDAIVRGISGGEKRRLSVAVQLLQDPDLLLLDEPTTGLDSYTSHYLIQTLAVLAKQENKIIIMSIHQPRSDIFGLLDTVGILSGGELVYYGNRQELVPYFTKLGHPCPVHANPLDFYIDLCSVDHRSASRETESMERVQKLRLLYTQSDIFARIRKDLENSAPSNENSHDLQNEHLELQTSHRTEESCAAVVKSEVSDIDQSCGYGGKRFFGMIRIHISRLYLYQVRDRIGLITRLFTMASAAFFNYIFCGRLEDNVQSIQDRIGLFYQTASFACCVPVIGSTAVFPYHRDLYDRESGDGLYNCVHFLIAYFTYILPFHVISSFLYSIWIYWGVGMYPDPSRFMIYTAVVIIQQHLGELQGLACWGIFADTAIGTAVFVNLISVSVLYASGLLKDTQDMIAPLKYTTYINHFKYASEVLAANELIGLEIDCSDEPNAAANCTIPGEYVLNNVLPAAEDNFVLNMGVLTAMVVCYWILVILVYVARGRRVLH